MNLAVMSIVIHVYGSSQVVGRASVVRMVLCFPHIGESSLITLNSRKSNLPVPHDHCYGKKNNHQQCYRYEEDEVVVLS